MFWDSIPQARDDRGWVRVAVPTLTLTTPQPGPSGAGAECPNGEKPRLGGVRRATGDWPGRGRHYGLRAPTPSPQRVAWHPETPPSGPEAGRTVSLGPSACTDGAAGRGRRLLAQPVLGSDSPRRWDQDRSGPALRC